jgi:sucrase/ferredoxin-like protein
MTSTPPPAWCEHGPGQHDGGVPSHASAPEASRAWLLIEYDGLWAEQAVATQLPGGLGKLAVAADELGIRVQLIRRAAREAGGRVFAAWTADPAPWLADVTSAAGSGVSTSGSGDGNGTAGAGLDLTALAAGERPASGILVERMYLVCVHGRRDRCCARFGGPLARALAPDYQDELWETTHVGGHKFAANLVLLPHGHYYGPCDVSTARAAIGAYERGAVLPSRYRGRAGQAATAQQTEYAALTAG